MRCPHCQIGFHTEQTEKETTLQELTSDGVTATWAARSWLCPSCSQPTVDLERSYSQVDSWGEPHGWGTDIPKRIYPLAEMRVVDPAVPSAYADLLRQASAVLPLSPMAAAALARRALQQVIRDKLGITARDLNKEIEEVLTKRLFPIRIANDLDAVRQVGNFAAHPIKAEQTGEIVDVEPGEAEWTIDILEAVLNDVFVEEAKARERRETLNEKLSQANKPPMRRPSD